VFGVVLLLPAILAPAVNTDDWEWCSKDDPRVPVGCADRADKPVGSDECGPELMKVPVRGIGFEGMERALENACIVEVPF